MKAEIVAEVCRDRRAELFGAISASSLDSVSEIEHSLKSLGLPTCIPILRGHGQKSPEALRGVTWHDWVADSEAALQGLLTEAERVIIVGHSMGGTRGTDLSRPSRGYSGQHRLGGCRRPIGFAACLRSTTSLLGPPDPSIVQEVGFAEVTGRRLPEVRVPTLIIQSRKDTTVSPESADIIYNTISTSAEQKRIMWLDVTEHEMFRNCEKNAIVEAIVVYVRERSCQME
jgi:carboxylesterase